MFFSGIDVIADSLCFHFFILGSAIRFLSLVFHISLPGRVQKVCTILVRKISSPPIENIYVAFVPLTANSTSMSTIKIVNRTVTHFGIIISEKYISFINL